MTLIDTLDTLVVMGNHSEFRRAVDIVRQFFILSAFDLDVNVSVFETTIRVLGGLLSAHLMAIDPLLGIYIVSKLNLSLLLWSLTYILILWLPHINLFIYYPFFRTMRATN